MLLLLPAGSWEHCVGGEEGRLGGREVMGVCGGSARSSKMRLYAQHE